MKTKLTRLMAIASALAAALLAGGASFKIT